MKPIDDEREEGEILEDDEDEVVVSGLAMEVDSDAESGEIKMNHTVTISKKASSLQEDLAQGHHHASLNPEKNIDAKKCDSDADYLLDTVWDAPNSSGEYGDLVGHEARKKSKPLRKSLEKEKKRIIDEHDFGHQDESRSLLSNENSYCFKHTDKDDRSKRFFNCTYEKIKLKRKLEPEEDEIGGLTNTNLILSPRVSKERRVETVHFLSREFDGKERSVSADRCSERIPEQLRENDAYESIQASCSARGQERNNNDHARSSRFDSLDKYTRRHNSKDRRNDAERSISRYGDRDRNTSHGMGKYDDLKDKHDSRGREGDRGKNREIYNKSERESEGKRKSKDQFRENDGMVNAKGEAKRNMNINDMDEGRIRDRKNNSPRERERVDHRERERRSNHDRHRDCRETKHEVTKYRKDRTKDKYYSIKSHDFEDEQQNVLREKDEEDYLGRIERQLAKQDDEDMEKIKEESRKRRQAILEKYKQQNKQLQDQANAYEDDEILSMKKNDIPVPQKINGVSSSEEHMEHLDLSDSYAVDPSFTVDKSPAQNGLSVSGNTGATCGLGEGSPKSERSTDMFCDDIFGESPAGVRKVGKDDSVKIDGNGLHDNWDDSEGYYIHRLGEVLDTRYEIIATHGKGVFSTVVRAKDLKCGKSDPGEVAIKIIRSNDTMYKAGMEELVILKKLAGADPEDKRHCVRFLSSFKYRNHLCLVFESLHMNLREVLKKFGRNIGLRLTAVRAYAKQLFIALKHLRNCGILHCDIKPDNMLVNEAKNVLKLCDFGNAMFAGKNDITPYLVSRFYRSPEIILGLTYDHPLDIWSVGCCLFEIYTGKVLFPGPSNNDMLRLHMELKGPFPKKMLRKGAFIEQHFDQDLNFHATENDPVTKKTIKRLLLNIKPKDIGTLISGSLGEDVKMLGNFKDLLERIFALDPEKRMTVSQALSHPFITGK